MILGEGVAVLTSCSQVLHSIPKHIQLKSTSFELQLLSSMNCHYLFKNTMTVRL